MTKRKPGRPRSAQPRSHRICFFLTAAEYLRLQQYRQSFARRPTKARVGREALLAFLSAAGVP